MGRIRTWMLLLTLVTALGSGCEESSSLSAKKKLLVDDLISFLVLREGQKLSEGSLRLIVTIEAVLRDMKTSRPWLALALIEQNSGEEPKGQMRKWKNLAIQ